MPDRNETADPAYTGELGHSSRWDEVPGVQAHPEERIGQVSLRNGEQFPERLVDPRVPARTQVLPVELVIRESAAAPAMAH